MKKMYLSCAVALAFASLSMAASTETKASAPRLSVSEIVQKNVAARGGLAAWRAVQALEMKGKMEAGGNNRAALRVPQGNGVSVHARKTRTEMPPPRPSDQVQLPFVMDLKRGRKVRVEIEFQGQTAVQVYDGVQGWKVRPFLNRHEVEKYTDEELKAASAQADLDGLLIDYAAKGSKVDLEGVEQVEGRDAYKLNVTENNGNSRHVWVDAQTFLETKIEGAPRRLDGKYHPVATYLRDYKSVNGLVMPYLLETAVEGVRDTEKIRIESIVSNPKLDDSRFAMPR